MFYLLTIHLIGMKVKRLTSKLLNVYKEMSSYIKWYLSWDSSQNLNTLQVTFRLNILFLVRYVNSFNTFYKKQHCTINRGAIITCMGNYIKCVKVKTLYVSNPLSKMQSKLFSYKTVMYKPLQANFVF